MMRDIVKVQLFTPRVIPRKRFIAILMARWRSLAKVSWISAKDTAMPLAIEAKIVGRSAIVWGVVTKRIRLMSSQRMTFVLPVETNVN